MYFLFSWNLGHHFSKIFMHFSKTFMLAAHTQISELDKTIIFFIPSKLYLLKALGDKHIIKPSKAWLLKVICKENTKLSLMVSALQLSSYF